MLNLKAKHKLNLNVKLESSTKLNLKVKPRYHIMYLVNFKLLKSPKLTNDHLEIGNFERNFDFGTTI